MNQNNLFTFKGFFPFWVNLNIITFFLIVEIALSVDQQFEACKPSNCGNNISISYPFWIQGKQNRSCGMQGFELTCKNDKPILNMSGDDYVVRDIFYKNQSIWVTNAKILANTCPSSIQNLSLPHTPFSFGPSHAELFLFFNCTTPFPNKEYQFNPTGCSTYNSTRSSLALFGHDHNFNYLMNHSGNCENNVVVAVDKDDDKLLYRDDINILLGNGFHLVWKAINCSVCEGSGGRCGFDYSKNNFMCFCTDRPHRAHCHVSGVAGSNVKLKFGIGVSIAGIIVIATMVVILCCLRRKLSLDKLFFWKKKTKNSQSFEMFLTNHGSVSPKRYKYSDIKKMTSSFKEKLGQGAYGDVFRGKLFDGRMVAVKVLRESKGNGEEFINEVASISRTSHVNVVTMLGFCVDDSKRALIYEFMPNGSLEKFIYDEKPLQKYPHLQWETLYKIAIGIARGLEYLHRGCNTRIVHFDIKPHNILLDQDLCPKISDFGLAKLSLTKESIISMMGARGTPGYIAPELFNRNFGGVSHKSDVYSYGMMLLEMVGGRKNIDVGVENISEIYFPLWIHKHLDTCRDLGLRGVITTEDGEIARKMILIGLWCIQMDPSNRPAMNRVLEMLEGNLNELTIPPMPFFTSPSRSRAASSTTSIL